MNKSLIHFYLFFEDTDECASTPCQNGGTCTDQINSYLCQCALGYTDLQCQTGRDVQFQKKGLVLVPICNCTV